MLMVVNVVWCGNGYVDDCFSGVCYFCFFGYDGSCFVCDCLGMIKIGF